MFTGFFNEHEVDVAMESMVQRAITISTTSIAVVVVVVSVKRILGGGLRAVRILQF